MLHDAVSMENPSYSILGNTAQRASGDFARHLLANFPSYFTPLFVSSDEKFDDASVAQSLCGIAFKKESQKNAIRLHHKNDAKTKIK